MDVTAGQGRCHCNLPVQVFALVMLLLSPAFVLNLVGAHNNSDVIVLLCGHLCSVLDSSRAVCASE